MAKITHIKITWGGVDVLSAESGDLSGTAYHASMKLKTYGGPSGKCVFKT